MPSFIFHRGQRKARVKRLQWIGFSALFCLLPTACNSRSSSIGGEAANFVVIATDQSFKREVLDAEQPVLVDMWAPWCLPCVEMKPALRDVAMKLHGEIKVVEVNIQENRFVKEKYAIEQLPTLMIFADGALVERSVGSRSVARLLQFAERYCRDESRSMVKPTNRGSKS